MSWSSKSEGFLLVEWCIYCTILITLFSGSMYMANHFYDENQSFEQISRHLQSTMKRIQMSSLYGSTNSSQMRNKIFITEHSYGSDTYVSDGKAGSMRIIHQLPPYIHIFVHGHFKGGIDFDDVTGRGDAFRVTLQNDRIKKKKIFIFSRQTGRIRREEHRY